MLADPEHSRADCERFLSFLSPALPQPRQTEDEEGWDMLEWAYDKEHVCWIVFPGNGTIQFEAKQGDQKQCGSTIMHDHVDTLTMRHIRAVYPASVWAEFDRTRRGR